MNLKSDISSVKGVGAKTAEAFYKANIKTVEDLIRRFPRTYEKFENIVCVKDILVNERNAVFACLYTDAKIIRYSNKSVVTVYAKDVNGDVLEVKFFNAPYLLKTLKKGSFYVFRGFVKKIGEKYSMSQPKMYKKEDYLKIEGKIGPIYSQAKDLSGNKIEKTVKEVIDLTRYIDDYLFDSEIDDLKLYPLAESFRSIHFPKDDNELYFARRRLVFEEFLDFYHMIRSDEALSSRIENDKPFIEVADLRLFEEKLPYKLTNAQKETIKDIVNDMTGPYLMNRLIQGDVGSGKTVVAIMALLLCAANNAQGALMAPTEVLAVQHFVNVKKFCEECGLCIKPVLLTGKMPAKAKKEALSLIKSGECNVVIGTHALFEEGVEFNDLKLAITDEQHRFGVNQREAFRDKGLMPHLLVMSATPIPRTLAMVMYGNVDISIMNELPKNRIPIKNAVVAGSYMKKSLEFIEKEVAAGHQAYVICPMIDESEEDNFNLKNVTSFTEELKEYYGERVRVTCLHGKMKADEKNRIMENFKAGNFDVLVSTTVIEVGVDVPNATVMLIENAERFGLSQLHQLRGRVGRGDAQSYCILMSDSKNEETIKRLKVLNETNDGFLIAKKDIELRGPGELNGLRQSGELSFALGDILNDSDVLMSVIDNYENLKERLIGREVRAIDFRTI